MMWILKRYHEFVLKMSSGATDGGRSRVAGSGVSARQTLLGGDIAGLIKMVLLELSGRELKAGKQIRQAILKVLYTFATVPLLIVAILMFVLFPDFVFHE